MAEQREIFYPKNDDLKRSYQGIVRAVVEQRRVVFSLAALFQAVFDHRGLPNDSNWDTLRAPGPNTKKIKNHLKTLTGTFLRPRLNGFEVFVFAIDGKRIATFSDLEKACLDDPELSEVIATTKRLDTSQEWKDELFQERAAPTREQVETLSLVLTDPKNRLRPEDDSKSQVKWSPEEYEAAKQRIAREKEAELEQALAP